MQTAVDWLIEQLSDNSDKAFNKKISLGEYHIKKNEFIEQAKEMEKKQSLELIKLASELTGVAGKVFSNMTPEEIEEFITGFRHGVSLTNGTH